MLKTGKAQNGNKHAPRPALHAMPSHVGSNGKVHRSSSLPPRRILRSRMRFGLFAIPLVLALIVIAGIMSGSLVPTLERQAVAAIERALPDTLALETGTPRFAFDLPSSIGVTFNDLSLKDAATGAALFDAESMSVTLGAMSLLQGAAEIRTLGVANAQITIPQSDNGPVFDFREMNNLDLHKAALADHFSDARAQLGDVGSHVTVEASNLTVVRGNQSIASIVEAEFQADEVWTLTASVQPTFLDTAAIVPVSGQAQFSDEETNQLMRIDLAAEDFPVPVRGLLTAFSDDPIDRNGEIVHRSVPANASLTMRRRTSGELDLQAAIVPETVSLKLGVEDFITAETPVALRHLQGDESISILPQEASIGRNSATLSGGLRWVDRPDNRSGYVEIELIANDGVLAPRDSPSQPLGFTARSLAQFDPETRLVDLPGIELRTLSEHQIFASGQMGFNTDVPVISVDVEAKRLTMAELQSLWPVPVARAARRWVLNNTAGGEATDIVFEVNEPLRRRVPWSETRLKGDTSVAMNVSGVRFDIAGEIPPVRQSVGSLFFDAGVATIVLDSGRIFMDNDLTADASNGVLTVSPRDADGLVPAQVSLEISGSAEALGQLITYQPIDATRFYEFEPSTLTGDVQAQMVMAFALNDLQADGGPNWTVDLAIENGGSSVPIEGRRLSGISGTINVNRQRADMEVDGQLDGIPAEMELVIPFGDNGIAPVRNIALILNEEEREDIAPGLNAVVGGTTPVRLTAGDNGSNKISVDLARASLTVPWLEWTKSSGIPGRAEFDVATADGQTRVRNLVVDGDGFGARGELDVGSSGLSRMNLSSVQMNAFDDFSVELTRTNGRYNLNVSGNAFDARTLIRRVRDSLRASGAGEATPITVNATLGRVLGFGGEQLSNVRASVRVDSGGVSAVSVTGNTASGVPFSFVQNGLGASRQIRLEAFDAGELLRFVDLYGQMRGGVLSVNLNGASGNRLVGNASIADFRIFNEPRLEALVTTRASDAGSLRDAVNQDINTQDVVFDLAYGDLEFGPGSLELSQGILRGPLVGLTLQGTAFDAQNQMRMTGTFLPAYGLNSLFADIPILGAILGNGRDRGLIGVTFLLSGEANNPRVTVNPLSVVAPGIFRSIFEFR